MIISAFLQSPSSEGDTPRKLRRKLQLEVPGAQADGETLAVRIHNISQGGMLIECEAPLAVDDKIDVELPHAGIVTAKLVWTSGSLFGCQFKAPISNAAVSAAELRAVALPASREDVPSLAGADAIAVEPGPAGRQAQRFGANLKRLRIARGLSQADLAAALEVSAPSISGWEKGRARPKADRLAALASLLGVPVSKLLVDLAAEPYEDLILQGRERIARATGASPDKIRIFIEI
ncbi:helix-turn-helix domain-containing protein [Sphingopyxis solisilvae]|uniref:helix-turn-helix domain-containing protein n=1 Tax=Sphingopyxis solisilvae TaxID=1886788 RepID=UPI0018929461|nr:helix-turn-helix domain-containing protein [Sphingopyxis solisilvae]